VKREEALTVVELVVSGWPDAKQLDRDEIDLYARSIEDLDAELAMSAVLRAIKNTGYRLKPNELRERVRMEKSRLAPRVAPLEPTEGRPLPEWVKRWICARLLHKRFDKPHDLRRFLEQGEFGDLTQEVMPEGAWLEESKQVGERDFALALQMMK